MRAIDNFAGSENGYSRTITVRNRLIPIGKTEEHIVSFIENDRKRAEYYPVVKKVMDRFHKAFIEVVLNDLNLDWTALYGKVLEYRRFKKSSGSDAKEKAENAELELKALQSGLRHEISEAFKCDPIYKDLGKSKELVGHLLDDSINVLLSARMRLMLLGALRVLLHIF